MKNKKGARNYATAQHDCERCVSSGIPGVETNPPKLDLARASHIVVSERKRFIAEDNVPSILPQKRIAQQQNFDHKKKVG